jgi:hypothetical protein
VKISDDEAYVIKSYTKVVKDEDRYDQTVNVDNANAKNKQYAEFEV